MLFIEEKRSTTSISSNKSFRVDSFHQLLFLYMMNNQRQVSFISYSNKNLMDVYYDDNHVQIQFKIFFLN